jgi:hypothetical protein
MLFRLSEHLPHDTITPVLKLVRDENTRRLITPCMTLLDQRGVFALRGGLPAVEATPPASVDPPSPGVFVWVGKQTEKEAVAPALQLAGLMLAVLGPPGRAVTEVRSGSEPADFLALMSVTSLATTDGTTHTEPAAQLPRYADLYGTAAAVSVPSACTTPVRPAKPAKSSKPPLPRPNSSTPTPRTDSRPGSRAGSLTNSRPSSATRARTSSVDSTGSRGSAHDLSLLSDRQRRATPPPT